jgi:hypothetical protein
MDSRASWYDVVLPGGDWWGEEEIWVCDKCVKSKWKKVYKVEGTILRK